VAPAAPPSGTMYPLANRPIVGRYQVLRISDNQIVVLDTTTGHCWSRALAGARPWTDLGSPAAGEGAAAKPVDAPRPRPQPAPPGGKQSTPPPPGLEPDRQ
jgi:hypothetical protein